MRNVKFAVACFGAERDCAYIGWCKNSSNLFGCFGLRDKKYCILNKQYTKEGYEALMSKIIDHMNEVPYRGRNNRAYRYGEFFPIELSPFPYDTSLAQEHFPLTRDEAEARGYAYRGAEQKTPAITVRPSELPDAITDTHDDIVEKTIGCEHGGSCLHQCTVGFKIIPQELQRYREFSLPLPRLCPNCRHYDRLTWRNPWQLWHRQCMCNGERAEGKERLGYKNTATHPHGENPCPNEFETSYAPERPEIVYCEQCYNAEIA